MTKSNRRDFLGRGAITAASAEAVVAVPAKAQDKPAKRVIYRNGKKPAKTPLSSGTVAYGNLLFISGVGYHREHASLQPGPVGEPARTPGLKWPPLSDTRRSLRRAHLYRRQPAFMDRRDGALTTGRTHLFGSPSATQIRTLEWRILPEQFSPCC